MWGNSAYSLKPDLDLQFSPHNRTGSKRVFSFFSCEVKETLGKKSSPKYTGSGQGRRNLLYALARSRVFLNKKSPNWKEGRIIYMKIRVFFSVFNRKFTFLALENYQASSRSLLGEVELLIQVSLCPMLPSSLRAKQLGLVPPVFVHCFLPQLNL